MPSRVEPNRIDLASGDHTATSDEKKPFQLGNASTTALASGAREASRRRSSSVSTVGAADGGAGVMIANRRSWTTAADGPGAGAGAVGLAGWPHAISAAAARTNRFD